MKKQTEGIKSDVWNWREIFTLLVFVVGTELVGAVGAFCTAPHINSWYVTIAKPIWTPPNFVFGPVWILLYALMGGAAYIVWHFRDKSKVAVRSLIFYGIHLILNVLWSYAFFCFNDITLALNEIILLWGFIAALIIMFWRVNRLAGALLIPYLGWVSFAVALNFAIWRLN